MANYPDIKGFNIQSKSSDPVPFAQAKTESPWAGAWASGGNLNTARHQMAAAGIQTASLAVGGSTPNTSTSFLDVVETYNGTSWTEITEINTARSLMGAGGTNTSAIVAGGTTTALSTNEVNNVESYNGSAWTETTEINTARNRLGAAGPASTAVLIYGGKVPPHSPTSATSTDVVEKWNGTSWTEVNELNSGRYSMASFGTSTSAIAAAGARNPPPGQVAFVESWNGSAWSETSDVTSSNKTDLAGAGDSNTSGIIFGGENPSPAAIALTESWDGTSWTEVNDLSTARYFLAGDGTPQVAIAFGGSNSSSPGVDANTEEWNFSGIPPTTTAVGYADAIIGDMYYNTGTGTFKVVKNGGAPIGTWSSGGSLNTQKGSNSGFGASKDLAISGGGAETPSPPPASVNVEEYNGTSWTEVNNLGTGTQVSGGFGTTSAGIFASGSGAPGAAITNVQKWNGTSWTEINDVNTGRRQSKGSGTTSAGIIAGGYTPSPATVVGVVESFNGTSWTETTDLNTARTAAGSSIASPSTDMVYFAGQEPANSAKTETWNGSSWTETTDMNTARNNIGSSGTSSTSALAFFGQPPPTQTAITESWNGTSWTEVADGATPRAYVGSAGSRSSAQINGGEKTGASPYYRAETEEWSYEDFEIKTVTTS